jgi:hypothetical protein
MHEFVTGQWAGSSYATGGGRVDHVLSFSPSGTFGWFTDDGNHRWLRLGTWRHDAEEDMLALSSEDDTGNPVESAWKIHFVAGLEDAGTILVLRWIGLASRNLPILFQRTHVSDTNSSWFRKS